MRWRRIDFTFLHDHKNISYSLLHFFFSFFINVKWQTSQTSTGDCSSQHSSFKTGTETLTDRDEGRRVDFISFKSWLVSFISWKMVDKKIVFRCFISSDNNNNLWVRISTVPYHWGRRRWILMIIKLTDTTIRLYIYAREKSINERASALLPGRKTINN